MLADYGQYPIWLKNAILSCLFGVCAWRIYTYYEKIDNP